MSAFRTSTGSILENTGSSLSGLNKFLSGPSSSSLTERTISNDSEDVKSPTATTTTTTLKNTSTTGTMTTKSLSAVRGLAGSLKRGVSKRIASASPLKKQNIVPVMTGTSGSNGAGSGNETPANYRMYPTTDTLYPTETAETQPTTTTEMTTIAVSLTEEQKVKDYRTFFQEQLSVASDTFVPIDSTNGDEVTMKGMGAGILDTVEDEVQDAVIDTMKDDCHCAFCTIQ